MTQPSQVFPPWLTPSVSAVTNAAGVPVATETTIVYLPLTYFGPSVSAKLKMELYCFNLFE